MLNAHIGIEDRYIFRIADARLRGEPRKRLRAGIEATIVAHGGVDAR